MAEVLCMVSKLSIGGQKGVIPGDGQPGRGGQEHGRWDGEEVADEQGR